MAFESSFVEITFKVYLRSTYFGAPSNVEFISILHNSKTYLKNTQVKDISCKHGSYKIP